MNLPAGKWTTRVILSLSIILLSCDVIFGDRKASSGVILVRIKQLENTADVVVVEELNTGFYPPPPNISNLETNQLPGQPSREHHTQPISGHLLRDPLPPSPPNLPPQHIDSRQEESFLEKLFGGGSRKEPPPPPKSSALPPHKQFIPVFHRRQDQQPAPRPPSDRRPPPPPPSRHTPQFRPGSQSPGQRRTPPYNRPPQQSGPVRQGAPRFPPYRPGTGGGQTSPGAEVPDLDQWRRAGYNVIWRQERQLFGDPEQECAYGSIETKVLFNNSLQGVGDLLIRIPYQEEWQGLFSEFVEESLEAKKKEAKNGTITVDDGDMDGSGDENTTDSTTEESEDLSDTTTNEGLEDTTTDEVETTTAVPITTTPKEEEKEPDNKNHPRMYCTQEGEVICRDGWTGPQCQNPICAPGCHPTQGYCKQPGECKCKSGYQGKNCEQCILLPGCKYGTCQTGYECICNEGYYGIFCNKPVCAEGCSQDNGFCREPDTCSCKSGWTGTNCTECIPRKGCKFGTCENPNECICDPKYQGVLCDEPVCAEGCDPENGECQEPGECTCKVGWKGENCTECVAYPGCLNGYCLTAWDCNCEQGWSGENCDIVDTNLPSQFLIEGKCKPIHTQGLRCMNGGVATCYYRNNGTIVGEPSCRCNSPFAGKFCQLNQDENR